MNLNKINESLVLILAYEIVLLIALVIWTLWIQFTVNDCNCVGTMEGLRPFWDWIAQHSNIGVN